MSTYFRPWGVFFFSPFLCPVTQLVRVCVCVCPCLYSYIFVCVIVPVCVCVLYTSPVGTCVHWNRLSLVLDTYEYTACLKQLIWVRHSGREDQSARVILKGCIQYIHLGNIRKHELMKKKLPGLSPKASKKIPDTLYIMKYLIFFYLVYVIHTHTQICSHKNDFIGLFFVCVHQQVWQVQTTKNTSA